MASNSICACAHCTQPLCNRVRTGLLLGYPVCCVRAYANKQLTDTQSIAEKKKQLEIEELYSDELDWFETKIGWGVTKQTKRGIDVYIRGGLTNSCGLANFEPCFECQHIILHQVLEGRQKLDLTRKQAFRRAISQIITRRRTWSVTYEPTVQEIQTRFCKVSDQEVFEVLSTVKK